MINRLNITTIK